ncbi:hypothetical protein AB7M45_007872 [Bradyrhizobium elkanii]|uniref:hypothetical protein n=1 Tax=Bradyrhizobium elkanii TaxID=29448 RepID=UPI000917D2EE|nr:hypothetical protein [Bradyrhizobium elkanii]MCW2195101.1 hypothetical protein [Bradyrhizobium elkanii]NWL67207.1 hypothetical protein [Bradyrhizobium elkanii]OIM94122.1 hypothetical protein BLN97_12685 [Bradyrhizobium elkanii]
MLIRASGNSHWRKFFFAAPAITIDGRTVLDVIEADDEAGYVVRYMRDEAGQLIEDGYRYATIREEGVVVFTGQRRWSPDDAKAAAQTKRDRRAIRNLDIQRRAGKDVTA